MRYLSLFHGIGAVDCAWVPLGWECVAYAEIEPFPIAVTKHHQPEIPNLGDVSKITDEQIAGLGPIDLVVGGSPCQDLSVAGKRAGLAGERSGLFHEQARIFNAARHLCGARWLLWENVPGAFSSHHGRDFAVVVGSMVGCEFGVPSGGWGTCGAAAGPNGLVEWRTLDAQYVRVQSHPAAVPQRRRRVFALLDSGNWQDRRPVLLEREGLLGHPAPRRESGERIASRASSGFEVGGALGPRVSRLTTDECAQGAAIVADFAPETFSTPAIGDIRRDDVASAMQAHTGGGGETQNPAFVVQEVAGTLTRRLGHNAMGAPEVDGGHYLAWPAQVASTLNAAFGDKQGLEDQHALNGAPLFVPVCMSSVQANASVDVDLAPNLNCLHEAPVVAFAQNQRDEVRECAVAGALSAEPGMKQQTYLAFTTEQTLAIAMVNMMGSKGNAVVEENCEASFTLNAMHGHDVHAIAFSCKDHSADAGEVSPTLRSMEFDGSHANGGGQVAVPTFALDGYNQSGSEEVCYPLRTAMGDGIPKVNVSGEIAHSVTQDSCPVAMEECSPALKIGTGLDMGQPPAVQQAMQVRRLTPRECERLQGFPDDYTLIDVRRHAPECGIYSDDDEAPCNCGRPYKPAADGPRYKALGNSMAVNVMRWIGERIDACIAYENERDAA